MNRAVQGIVAAALLIGGWQMVVIATGAPRYILPPPADVARAFIENAALIASHGSVTLAEVVIGLVVGAALGAGMAVLLALSRTVSAVLGPILLISQAVPVFALAPILTLWLGYGIMSKAAMAVLIIFFPVASAFYDGLMRLPSGLADLSQVLGASRWRQMWHLRIPAAAPALASGLKIAAVYAPIGAVIGEWVGSSEGLGYLMLLANGRAKTDLMFAALAALAAMTLALHWGVGRLAARLARYGSA
ncbi:MAG: putative hydroxymethylpyrimidine transport system permease protein [Paracoccaceae bacterium]|jgi:putative hydroxymethylpyrimidine transport system permease protein